MPNSKYPSQLDTSVEIPAVRDNIIEIGSDVINSLRSAIFQIERVLGINPQGAVGSTVADRLNKIIDGNGNLLDSALEQVNVLSGPISDNDVAKNAAISESKLNLNFSTHLLQDEIAILNNLTQNIIEQIEDLSAVLTAHVNVNALNRHPATAISTTASTHVESSTATIDLEEGNVQSALEVIYNSHIHYDGTDISVDNRSHEANQIYFDNQTISAITDASDVQEAIDDLGLSALSSQIEHQDRFHANGILRIGKVSRGDNSSKGELLAEASSISFVQRTDSTNKLATITFENPPSIGEFNVQKSDIITIEDVSDENSDFVGEYEISDITLSDDLTSIESLEVYGTFKRDSTSLTTGAITKNINERINAASLLASARQDASLTSSKILQVCNPDAVRIISENINPAEITSTNKFFDISIDGESDIQLEAYNIDVARQSIDSIVSILNEQIVEQHLSILAYRLDKEDGKSELVISHNLPDTDSESHTLRVSASSDNGLASLGFSDIEDKTITSNINSAYYISGQPFTGLVNKLDEIGMVYATGSNVVDVGSLNIDLLELNIRIGDLLIITGAGTSSDNGTYIISGVNSDQIIIDSAQLPTGFVGTNGTDTKFRIYENTVSLDDLTFEEVSTGFGAAVVDLFLNKNREIFFCKRLEYEAKVQGVESLISIVDFRGEIADKSFNLTASIGTDDCIDFSIDSGDIKTISGDDNYFWVISGEHNVQFKLYVPSTSFISSQIILDAADISLNIFGFEGVNSDTNLLISRVTYDQFKGRIGGGQRTPRAFGLLPKGNIGPDEISDQTKYIISERPLDELRANGVIYGLEVTNATIDGNGFYNFDLSRGIAYVSGKRFELDERIGIITDIDSTSVDKLFIFVNEYGNIVFESADPLTCGISSEAVEMAMLASIEKNGSVNTVYDLRLFIDELDLKLLNSITVSPQHGMGHFSSINKAVRYAKRFSEIFPDAGTPTIHLKSGEHRVVVHHDSTVSTNVNTVAGFTSEYDEGIWINFPVHITGEGDSTILNVFNAFTDLTDPIDSDKITSDNVRGRILIACSGLDTTLPSQDVTTLQSGFVTLSNFRLKNSRVVIADPITQDTSGIKLNFGITLDGLTFDNTANTSFSAAANFGPRIRQIDVANGTSVGNVVITNCQLLNAHIRLDQDAADYRNISITNNFSRGNGSTIAGGTDNFLMRVDGAGHIFDLNDAPSENNIEFRNNFIADNLLSNDDASGPKIDANGDHPWGDRISRSVSVGNRVNTPLVAPIDVNDGAYLRADDGTNFGSVYVQAESGTSLANVIISSTNKVVIESGTLLTSDLDLSSGRHITLESTADTEMTVGDDLTISVSDTLNLEVENNIDIESNSGTISIQASSGTLTLNSSTDDVTIGAGGGAEVIAISDIDIISANGSISINADDDLDLRTDSDLNVRSDGNILISQDGDTAQGATTTFVGNSTTRATVEVQGAFSVTKAGTGHASDGAVRAEHGFAHTSSGLSAYRTNVFWISNSSDLTNINSGDQRDIDISDLTSDPGFSVLMGYTVMIEPFSGANAWHDGQGDSTTYLFHSLYNETSEYIRIFFDGTGWTGTQDATARITIIYIPS